MNTTQITIITMVSLIFIISLYISSTTKKEHFRETANYFVLQKENKCPEYEKVENVYKLKE